MTILAFSDVESLGRDHKKHAGYAKGKGGMVTSISSNVSSWDSSYYHSTDKAFAAENVERPKHWQKDAKASK